MGELSKEVWIDDIIDNLYAGNPHMDAAISHDEFADYDIVRVPNAGSKPNVVKNRQTLPAPITNRQDSVKKYELGEFTTDPFLVPNIETTQLTYNKRDAVMGEHRQALNERIGTEAIYAWVAEDSSRIVRTTGAQRDHRPDGSTGQRNKLKLQEIREAWEILRDDEFQQDFYIMLTPGAYMQLLEESGVDDARNIGRSGVLADGVVDFIYGFNIMVRSRIPIFDNSSTPKLRGVEEATGNDDNFGFPCWSRPAVARAADNVDVFMQERVPQYYGGILSGLVMFGASQLYQNGEGTAVIVQTN